MRTMPPGGEVHLLAGNTREGGALVPRLVRKARAE